VNELNLSSWALNVSPSPTLAVDSLAKAMKAEGRDVCGFGSGEPDFDTPDFIKKACIEALEAGKTKYTPAPGIPELRKEIAVKYQTEYGFKGVDFSNVVVSPGGKFSCYLAILALCNPGDEVIIPAPYWVSYPEMVKLAGANPVEVFAGGDQDFKITPAQLDAAVTAKTRLFILNSPSNPTGTVYTEAEIRALYEVCKRHNLWILSDEIYEYLLYEGTKHFSVASIGDDALSRTIIASGFSKTYSMTGWRLGTLLAPSKVAKAIGDLQSQTSSNPTSFAQYGALAAMRNPEASKAATSLMIEAFDRRRKFLYAELLAIKGITCPKALGAFYLFPDISSFGLSANEFATRLLKEKEVAVVPGEGFGAPGYIRLSYATSDEVIKKGIVRIREFCESL
jgi:aspartate aminotransferase